MIGQQLAQHRDEAVDGVGRFAVRSRQPANRVIGAIHLVAAVDQEQAWDGAISLYYYSIVRAAFALVLISTLLSLACANVVARKYEYEEEVFLALDGSATVYVNASVPALVALRGFALPLDPNARLDRTSSAISTTHRCHTLKA